MYLVTTRQNHYNSGDLREVALCRTIEEAETMMQSAIETFMNGLGDLEIDEEIIDKNSQGLARYYMSASDSEYVAFAEIQGIYESSGWIEVHN